jgi:hypothetical protein
VGDKITHGKKSYLNKSKKEKKDFTDVPIISRCAWRGIQLNNKYPILKGKEKW